MIPVMSRLEPFSNFTERLTALCLSFGIGVEGGTLYEMTPEDGDYHYRCEDDGKLVRYGNRARMPDPTPGGIPS